MANISFSSDNLRKLLRVNSYAYSEINMMVFGIRGASVVDADTDVFKTSHLINQNDVDYKTPKCIIGIWNPIENKIALFPASTVPHLNYIKKHLAKTARANCIMTGYYSYYEKGFHNPSAANRHQALRLATNIALRRSNNDLTYANDDIVEVGNPNDNLHAAYNNSQNEIYSSAGCQVIVGQPKCVARGNKANTLYWKKFHDIIYNVSQSKFDYALFRFADAEFASINGNTLMQARLRFGSKGNLVSTLQTKLKQKGYFNTNNDGDFGRNTLIAVLKYQTDKFGINEADGVVGNGTATSLGFSLDMI